MSTKARRDELSTEISALCQRLDEASSMAQSLVDRFEKNSNYADCLLFVKRALACINEEEEQGLEHLGKIDWVALAKR